jgi:hypothetical protein
VSHELFAYLGNDPTLPRAAAPPPPLRNGHEYDETNTAGYR